MNRFKTKKRVKDDAASARPSLESESSFSLFSRKKKSHEQEEKKEIDLATALPSSDDFRTSLLMSGLSARFSMLREQDDPSTKIGKASDDSVLLPKRHSRMNDFNFGTGAGLGDIAEVESIKAPPFLRTDSTASEESGSVLSRARPVEGNVMFGGRQKIYKIAVGSSSSKNLGDGMSGRALYDNDVSMSAFQKWRQTAKEQDQDNELHGEAVGEESRPVEDSSFTRAESPLPQGYNKKRETSSTTSSTPSGGRNSTAATSVISQPTTLHSQQTTAASSATSTPALERHVTRTRRLYEQGLTQDLQEQQHSVLSRVDTLTRRPGGVRTPDLGRNSPSPTMHSFSDRFGERRTILSKASAPNLRSMSPPTTGSSVGTLDLNTKATNAIDTKTSFLASPPLSPPISDHSASDQPNLSIQPKDLGKATAMGVFQRPSQPYDDSRYAERQLQLKQGRETPTQRSRKDSSTSFTYSRSQSVASNRQQESDSKANVLSTQEEASVESSQQNDPLESPILNDLVHQPSYSPQVRVQRPADQDHPALRGSAIPTPLSVPQAPNDSQSNNADLLNVKPKQVLLGDSPTLGPNSGLGGLVRQHLRTESDVSSIFGTHDSRESMAAPKNPWEDQDWTTSSGQESERSLLVQPKVSAHNEELPKSNDHTKPDSLSGSPHSPDEEDEFASQLANARRRVREKLTSFVETDNTPSLSPQSPSDSARDLPPPSSRSNPLGILRGKGSRGSLIDRGRDTTTKSNKMNGTSATTMPTPPSSVKLEFDEHDRRTPIEIKEHPEEESEDAELKEEANAHPGLRAFRQARRELQKRKELEALARHPPQNGLVTSSPASEKGALELRRTPSRELQPAGFGQRRKASDEHSGRISQPPPLSQSRTARDRSGSEDSAGQSRSRSRPTQRSRENTISNDDQKLNAATRRPKLRSPGLPGTDIRRSPHMPPLRAATGGPQSVVPGPFLDRTNSGTNLRVLPLRTGTEPLSAGASPLSPRGGAFRAISWRLLVQRGYWISASNTNVPTPAEAFGRTPKHDNEHTQ
ncbi:hypothetical protein INS49_009700 [Diaporthe citri]|uniref:uncharacterized protein n=1 Tax=Diaporthe citri TaxID=83186 RepID=UPI001C7FAB54|nr:uncharacterized protein INS49_009700 [Diaporthe citri]KAG6361473.1 hypothetical protein INS49_009700 [Diaporthe citri]